MKNNKTKYLTLKEVHEALTNILAEFDRICRENNLCYTIAYGTMIGAVRHKGFIPWDDDIDVFMPRPDYERFYALVKSGEIKLSEHFLLSDDRGKHAYYAFTKLMDDRYRIKSWSHIEVPYLYIDIFPLDGAPDNEKEMKKLRKRCLKYSAIGALARWAVPDHKWAILMRVFLFPFYLFGSIYGTARAARKANYYAKKNDFYSCERCSLFNFEEVMGKWTMEREKFFDLVELPFENINVYCISAYDEWLTNFYGNYMQLPPENKRITHGLKVWRVN